MNEYANCPRPIVIDHIKGMKTTQVLLSGRELENTKASE